MDVERLGKYALEEEIGRGGMGVVYRARHVELKRVVALKAIREASAGKPEHLERFKREAATCARLSHPNVVQIFDYGEDGGTCFYVMELVDAPSLKGVLAEKGRLSERELLDMAAQLADALGYIHGEGLVHRDIKPANIMLAADGKVTLMDFGLVKVFQATALTDDGKAIGTPRYMSPEMLRAGDVDARSDVFQTGVVLYEAATGAPPFAGKDVYTLAGQVLRVTPERPSAAVRRLHPSVDALILNCLEKDPADRYATAADLAGDIRRASRRLPVSRHQATPAPGSARAADNVATDPMPPSRPSTTSTPGTGAFTLSFSSRSLSRITTGVQTLGGTVGRRGLLAAVVALAFLGWLFLGRGGAPQAWDALQAEALPDVGAVILTWSSSRPYPSQVSLWSAANPASRETRSAPDRTPTTSHRLVLEGLPAGVAHGYEIVYPDGTASLAQSLPPLPTEGLRVTDHEVLHPSLRVVEVRFTTSLPCRAEATWVDDGGRHRRTLSTGPERHHVLRLDDLSPLARVTDLSVTLRTELSTAETSLGAVDGAAAAIAATAATLAAFDPAPIMAAVAEPLKARPEDIDHAAVAAALEAPLAASRPWALYVRQKALLREFMADPAQASSGLALTLYAALRRLESLEQFLDDKKAGVDLDVRSTYAPLLHPTWDSSWPPGPFVEIFALSEADSSFVPEGIDEVTGTARSLFDVYSQHEEVSRRRKLTATFDASPILARPGSPRLVLRTRNLRPAFHVAVSFNGGPPLHLRNTAATAPPELYLWDRQVKDEENDDYRRSVNYVGLTVPRHLLRPGSNDVTVSLRVYPGYKTMNWVQLRSLRLYPPLPQ